MNRNKLIVLSTHIRHILAPGCEVGDMRIFEGVVSMAFDTIDGLPESCLVTLHAWLDAEESEVWHLIATRADGTTQARWRCQAGDTTQDRDYESDHRAVWLCATVNNWEHTFWLRPIE
jgi:hypothetical protein